MAKIKPKIKADPWDIFSIDLEGGECCYGYLTDIDMVYSFLDYKGKPIKTVDDILTHPVLFTVMMGDVDDSDIKWKIIGIVPEEKRPREEIKFFKQDVLNPKNISLYFPGGREKPCTFLEAQNLECAAVWYPSQVEDRLRDHFEGKPNKWLETLQLKEPN